MGVGHSSLALGLKTPQLPPPKQKDPVPYKTWTASPDVDWLEIEKQLKGKGAPSGSSAQPARDDSEDDDEENNEDSDDDDEEEEENFDEEEDTDE